MNIRRHPSARIALLGALALAGGWVAATAGADDSVLIQVQGNDKFTGTLRPAAETEAYICDVPAGTKIKGVAKGKGKGAPATSLVLVDLADANVATGVQKGSKSTLKTTVATSARYLLRVAGDGTKDGDYTIKVKFKPQTKFSGDGVGLDANAEATFVFSVPDGSTAKIICKGAGKSAFVPELLDVTGPNAFTADISLGTPAHQKPGKASTSLGDGGDYTVRFRNGGAAPGDWKIKVVVKAPKAFKTSLDITDNALAKGPVGGQQVAGQVIGASGGTFGMPAIGGPLDGTSLSIPSGALGVPTLVTMQPGTPFTLPPGQNQAGPSVNFGPSGTQFASDATVTIPYESAAFDDVTNQLVVYVRNDVTGELQLVPQPYQIDEQTGLCSFPASHFSTYMAGTSNARPFNGDFFQLRIGGGPNVAFGGRLEVGLNEIAAEATEPTGNPFIIGFDGAVLTYDVSQTAVIDLALGMGSSNGTVDVFADDSVSLFINATETEVPLRRGLSSDALILAPVEFGDVGTGLVLRRAPGPPTVNSLLGKWRALVWEFSAAKAGVQAQLSGGVSEHVLTFKNTGAVTVNNSSSGTFTLGPGSHDVSLNLGLGEALLANARLGYCAGGNVLMGFSSGGSGLPGDLDEGHVRALVLVRETTGANEGLLNDNYDYASFQVRDLILDGTFEWVRDDLGKLHNGGGQVSSAGDRVILGHQQGTGVPTRILATLTGGNASYSVTGVGRYVEGNNSFVGTVANDGSFYVSGSVGSQVSTLIGFGLQRAPPEAMPKR